MSNHLENRQQIVSFLSELENCSNPLLAFYEEFVKFKPCNFYDYLMDHLMRPYFAHNKPCILLHTLKPASQQLLLCLFQRDYHRVTRSKLLQLLRCYGQREEEVEGHERSDLICNDYCKMLCKQLLGVVELRIDVSNNVLIELIRNKDRTSQFYTHPQGKIGGVKRIRVIDLENDEEIAEQLKQKSQKLEVATSAFETVVQDAAATVIQDTVVTVMQDAEATTTATLVELPLQPLEPLQFNKDELAALSKCSRALHTMDQLNVTANSPLDESKVAKELQILSQISMPYDLALKGLRLHELNDALVLIISKSLITANTPYQHCCAFVDQVLLAKSWTLQQNASRFFFNSIQYVAKLFPKPIIENILYPLTCNRATNTTDVSGSAQYELMNRIVQQPFIPKHLLLLFLEKIVSSEKSVVWSDFLFALLTRVLDLRLNECAELSLVFTKLLFKLEECTSAYEEFGKSVKFASLLLSMVTKYNAHTQGHKSLIKEMLRHNESFVKKSVLQAINKQSDNQIIK